MKTKSCRFTVKATLAMVALACAPILKAQTTFFSDNFAQGSTLNSASPAKATSTNTAYQLISGKTWNPTPSLNPGDLKFGIGPTTSGDFEIEALFATNAVALVQAGDYIQLTVVFTNTSGILTEAGQLGIGLYNSGQSMPIAGGMNGTAVSKTAGVTGGAQQWEGYAAQVNYNGAASRIMTRPSQSETTGNNQDLITQGSSSYSYSQESNVGSTSTSTLALTPGAVYTEVLYITLNGQNSLAITNLTYSGNTASGVPLDEFGGVATNSTYLTGGFDSMAFGYFGRANASANTIDVSSISVSGSVTAITGPPTITAEPSPVTVTSGGSCAFQIQASGFDVTYQWGRSGTNIVLGGNLSVINSADGGSSLLVVSPAEPADLLSSANGYYCTVKGAGGFTTNSTATSLAFVASTNLVYSGSGAWDLGISPSWNDTSGDTGLYFNFGDPVTFNDVGGGGTVTLNGSYLSAASVTVSHSSSFYTFTGSGSFAGPGNLIYSGSGLLNINNANTYSGGTVISNSLAYLRLGDLAGLGSGPINLALAGGQMEITPASSSVAALPNDLVVSDDFTLVVDPTNNSYALVLNGSLSGTAGKTLTLVHSSIIGSGVGYSRIRVFSADTNNMVYNANLNLNDSTFLYAPYQSSSSVQSYNGVISGAGSVIQKGGTTYLNGQNTYTGFTQPAAGQLGLGTSSVVSSGSLVSGPLGAGPFLIENDSTTTLGGSGTVFAAGAAQSVANPIQYASGSNNLTLVVVGTNQLTFSGPFSLNGNDGGGAGTNRFIQADGPTLFSGVISDGGVGVGFTKTGSNVLTMANAETYTGPTTVSDGTLQVNGSLASASSVTVATNGTLAGSGTIGGNVVVNAGGAIMGGPSSIGTLAVSGNLTLNGNVSVQLNTSAIPSNGLVSVAGTLTGSGTGFIILTNLGPALQVGDTFALFSQPVANAGGMKIVGGDPGLVWTNKLAVDGTISVLSLQPLASTNSFLSSLVLSSAGALSPAFGSTQFGYTASAVYGATPTVSVVDSDLTATNQLIYGGATNLLASGVASAPLALNPNPSIPNLVTVEVTAQDGVTKHSYSITINQAPSQTRPSLASSVHAGAITFNWPLSNTGYRLLVQTNNLANGISKNASDWMTVPGTTGTNSAIVSIVQTNLDEYYRLVYP